MSARAAATVLLAALCACALSVQSLSSAVFSSTSRTTSAVTAAFDWTPPSVSVTSPSAGQIVAGQVTVTAAAADARSAIASVSIEVAVAGSSSWQPLCTDSAAPFSCTWSTTAGSFPDGDYDLRAIATDTVGLSATSAAVIARVANAAGVVLGFVPSVFRSGLALEATVVGTGVVPASNLSFQYRVSPSGSWTTITACTQLLVNTATCTWTPAGAAEVYDVRAVAVVGLTTYTDTEAAIQFDPTPPAVTLTVPVGILRGTVQLAAAASDEGSGVAGVGFEYRLTGTAGWTACGTDSEPPYTCALSTTTLVNGATYEFRATATDVAGNATTTPDQSRVVDNREATVDRVRFTDAELGQVSFVQDYVRANGSVAFAATMAASTAVADGVTVTVVTVTIGAPTGSTAQLRSSTVTGAMRWTPSASATTPTGSACSVASATETGARDKDL